MAEAVKNGIVFFLRREVRRDGEELAGLKVGRERTRTLINQAYSGFNATKDPDLIESYVFEINALQARYTYLLRRVKELEGREG